MPAWKDNPGRIQLDSGCRTLDCYREVSARSFFMSLKSPKTLLRSEMQQRIALIEKTDRRQIAFRTCASLRRTPVWRNLRALLVYMAFGDELSADPLIEAALAEGKSVFAPAIRDDDLEFRAITSLKEPFPTGVFGIREPAESARRWNSLATVGPAAVLVPGLAFDRTGGRLGRGRGYYDRFIAKTRLEAGVAGEHPPLFIGYAFPGQLIDSVPTDSHDEPVDGLVTEKTAEIF